MFKRLTTLTVATGATVFAASLFAADDAPAIQAKYQLVSDITHPTAPAPTGMTAPVAPSGPFSEAEVKAQQEKQPTEKAETGTEAEKTVGATSDEATPPSGLFKEQILAEKPSAPEQPVLSASVENTESSTAEKTTTSTAPTEPVPVAPKAVSMDIAPQVEKKSAVKNEADAAPVAHNTQGYAEPLQVTGQPEAPTIEAPTRPKAPEAMEKPVEMVAPEPQPQQAEGGNGQTSHTGGNMTMPSMNMNMPNVSMPAVNMNMPTTTTSMGTNVSSQTVEVPVPTQPAAQQPVVENPTQPTAER